MTFAAKKPAASVPAKKATGKFGRGVIQRTKWIWDACSWEWKIHEDTPFVTPPPSILGWCDGHIVDTAARHEDMLPRVVYAAGNRINEFPRAEAHPHRHYDLSDIQSEADVRRKYGYPPADDPIFSRVTDRHGIDAMEDETPSLLTHVPFLETGRMYGKNSTAPLTSEVMAGIFRNQDRFQSAGHRISVDIKLHGRARPMPGKSTPKDFGARYKLKKATLGTHYRLIKRLRIRRPLTHVKTKVGSGREPIGLSLDSENTRRLIFERTEEPVSDTDYMDDVLTDTDADASEYEDEIVETRNFSIWMQEISRMAREEYHMSLDDLPDAPFRPGFETGLTPDQFYSRYLSHNKAFFGAAPEYY